MGGIWATAVTRVVNDLEIVTYSAEEHWEMKPPIPVSKQQRPVFINSNPSDEPGLSSGSSGSTSGCCFSNRSLGAQNPD